MNTQRVILLSASALGAIFLFTPWATAPFVGEIKGINNGSGMFSLLCIGIIIILSLMGDTSSPFKHTAKIISCFLSGCIIVSTIIFISNVADADRRAVAASNTIFGNILDPGVFSVQSGAYFMAVIGVVLLIVSISFTYKEAEEY